MNESEKESISKEEDLKKVLRSGENSRNTNINSDHFLLESKICQRTLYRRIRDIQGNTIPLLRYLQFGIITGLRIGI